MAQELTLYPAGLITDPNPHSAAPAGSMVVADNVVMRRAGELEPRVGTLPVAPPAAIGAGNINRLLDVDEEILEWAGPTVNSGLYRQSDGAQILSGIGQSIFTSTKAANKAEAARNTYLTTGTGTRRIVDASVPAPTADLAGVPQGLVPRVFFQIPSAVNDWFLADNQVAYRIVFKKTVNGQDFFGAPSGRSDLTNPGGGLDTWNQLTVPIPVSTGGVNGGIGVVAGDVCQVYRSRLSGLATTPASDEMYLVVEQEVTPADIVTTVMTVDDYTSDENIGASLYTNATQEGILQSNYRPPASEDLAYYAGMMFYGRTTSPWRMSCSLLDPEIVRTVTINNVVVGIGNDYFTAPAVDERDVGRYVGDWFLPTGWNGANPYDQPGVPPIFPPGTRIGSVDPATLRYYTVDYDGIPVVALNTAAGPNNVELHGAIIIRELGTGTHRAYFSSSAHLGAEDAAIHQFRIAGAGFEDAQEVVESMAYVVSRDKLRYVDLHPTTGNATEAGFILEERTLNYADGFSFEYAPVRTFSPLSRVGPWSVTEAALATQENVNNRVMFSKQLQQEAVPIVNFIDVGSEKAAVQRLMETRDSLFVFKEDGLYRISGTGPFSLRLDTIDAELRLVHPKACVQHRNAVYAWTNRGFISVSGSGVRELSQQVIQSEISESQQAVIEGSVTTGAFCFASELHDEVYFSVPLPSNLLGSQLVYIFSRRTGSFTRWNFTASGNFLCDGLYRESDGALVFGGYLAALLTPQFWTEQAYRSDESFVANVGLVTSLGNDLYRLDLAAVPAGYTPSAGDVFILGAVECIATAFDGALAVTVRASALPVAGLATIHEAYTATNRFKVKEAQNPGALKHWSQATAILEDWRKLLSFEMGFSTNVSTTRGTVSPALSYTETETARVVRCAPTRNASRAAELNLDITVHQAAAHWRLAGLTLTYNPTSTRVQT